MNNKKWLSKQVHFRKENGRTYLSWWFRFLELIIEISWPMCFHVLFENNGRQLCVCAWVGGGVCACVWVGGRVLPLLYYHVSMCLPVYMVSDYRLRLWSVPTQDHTLHFISIAYGITTCTYPPSVTSSVFSSSSAGFLSCAYPFKMAVRQLTIEECSASIWELIV